MIYENIILYSNHRILRYHGTFTRISYPVWKFVELYLNVFI